MTKKHWLLESAMLLAVSTGALYTFGGYYDYRFRYEFDIQTITLDHAPETLLRDGASIFFAWLGTSIEFWIALAITILVSVPIVYVSKKSEKIKITNVNLIVTIFVASIFYMSVNFYIPSRAQDIAQSIVAKALAKKHVLHIKEGAELSGYTVMGTPTKVVFLSSDKNVYVVPYTEVKTLKTGE